MCPIKTAKSDRLGILGGGSLIVQEVVDENGNDIIQDIRIGDRFVTPSAYIDARYERVTYTPQG